MNEDSEYIDKMRRLASALPREASPRLEQRLSAAFRARPRRKAPVWMCAAAACVLLLLGSPLVYKRKTAPPRADFVFDAPGFIALPYAQSGVPLESLAVIRVSVTPAQLSSLGVAVPATASTAGVKADVLVGQDGVARAVRLVK